jgi:hypothetical protein
MDEMQKVLLHEQQKNGKILMQVGLLMLLSFFLLLEKVLLLCFII